MFGRNATIFVIDNLPFVKEIIDNGLVEILCAFQIKFC